MAAAAIRPPAPVAERAAAPRPLDAAEVTEAQRRLAELGFDTNVVGPRLQEAWRAFFLATGRAERGRVTNESLEALRQAAPPVASRARALAQMAEQALMARDATQAARLAAGAHRLQPSQATAALLERARQPEPQPVVSSPPLPMPRVTPPATPTPVAPARPPPGAVVSCNSTLSVNMGSFAVVNMVASGTPANCRWRFTARAGAMFNPVLSLEPRNGSVRIEIGNNEQLVFYQPRPGFSGSDRFEVTRGASGAFVRFEVTVTAP